VFCRLRFLVLVTSLLHVVSGGSRGRRLEQLPMAPREGGAPKRGEQS